MFDSPRLWYGVKPLSFSHYTDENRKFQLPQAVNFQVY